MDYTRNGIANFVEIAVSENDHTIQRVKLNCTAAGQVAILFNGSNGFSENINKAKSAVTLFSLLLALLIDRVISNTLSILFCWRSSDQHIVLEYGYQSLTFFPMLLSQKENEDDLKYWMSNYANSFSTELMRKDKYMLSIYYIGMLHDRNHLVWFLVPTVTLFCSRII